ncbi:hypothetical protein BC832DRAFT_552289 [Gaertneriomyces semiglobifer]|nr:hypothetical protein BC832DRAFT_552289 [Gaertneriomyces semiglobifer]
MLQSATAAILISILLFTMATHASFERRPAPLVIPAELIRREDDNNSVKKREDSSLDETSKNVQSAPPPQPLRLRVGGIINHRRDEERASESERSGTDK